MDYISLMETLCIFLTLCAVYNQFTLRWSLETLSSIYLGPPITLQGLKVNKSGDPKLSYTLL